jgi:hypothetical protein
MIPTAMLAVAYATGRASHARQVKGDDPDKKGITGIGGLSPLLSVQSVHVVEGSDCLKLVC